MQLDTGSDDRFFSSTRGKIALLLRGAPRTVEQLALQLDLTDNAVRAHLVALERDGLVLQCGSLRTGRRPSLVYELTPAAERLFPKAYGTVLSALLGVLAHELPHDQLQDALRSVGRQLAEGQIHTQGEDLAEDAASAAGLLESLGGSVTVELMDHTAQLVGRSCPLAIVVREHPEACELVEALLGEVTGARVTEACERSDQPRCHFSLRSATPLVV